MYLLGLGIFGIGIFTLDKSETLTIEAPAPANIGMAGGDTGGDISHETIPSLASTVEEADESELLGEGGKAGLKSMEMSGKVLVVSIDEMASPF